MRTLQPIPDEHNDDIIKMFMSGYRLSVICKKYNIKPQSLQTRILNLMDNPKKYIKYIGEACDYQEDIEDYIEEMKKRIIALEELKKKVEETDDEVERLQARLRELGVRA